jgi:hypothetical protein
MSRARRLATWLAWAAIAWGQTCAPGVPVLAAPPAEGAGRGAAAVAIGETGTAVSALGPGTAEGPVPAAALRDALAREVARIPTLRLMPQARARYVLRSSVTRFERRAEGGEAEVRCEVSIVVADAGGNIRLVTSGRAGARGGDDARLARAALEGAVRGALRPLGDALRR